MSEEHENFIKTPKQLVIIVVLAFVVPVVAILLLSQLMITDKRPRAGESPAMLAERVKPIGELAIAGPKVLLTGDKLYESLCKTCHEAGLAGAPKFGDATAWAKVIAQGQATTVQHAITGIRAMPPKGGNPDLTDEEVAGGVVFMANKAGANWKAPELKMPAEAPSLAAAPVVGPPSAAGTPTVPPAIALPAMPAPAAPTPATGPATTLASAASSGNGKQVYDTVCMVCHAAGIAGAPKMGDKAAWSPRIKQGMDTLHTSALKGKNAMPAKGGNTALSDADVMSAVDYMVGQSK
jgi:cytochrome c5